MPDTVILDKGRLCHYNHRTSLFVDNPILTIPVQEVAPILRAGNGRTYCETVLTSTSGKDLDQTNQGQKSDEKQCNADSDFIKDEYQPIIQDRFTNKYYEYEEGQKHRTVKRRLKQHLVGWFKKIIAETIDSPFTVSE